LIRTIVICPQKRERERIASRLSREGNIKVLAHGKDSYDALRLVSSHKPDIVILDNNLEFINVEEIPPLLKIRSPSTAIVIVVAKISDHQLYKAAKNEVSGIVNKEADIEALPVILKTVYEGRCFISPVFAGRVLRLLCSPAFKAAGTHGSAENKGQVRTFKARYVMVPSVKDPAAYLSRKELKILVAIGEGHTSADIAKKLGLTAGTVRNYISTVMRKTGMNNRTQMVRYAYSSGLVPLSPVREMV